MANSYEVYEGTVKNVAVDFSGELRSGELLVDDVNLVVESTEGITIANDAVTTAALDIKSVSVATGKAVTFSVTSTTAGSYVIKVTVTTDASNPQTLRDKINHTVLAW